MAKSSSRQTKKAAKARLSGAIASFDSPRNKHVFGDDDEIQTQNTEHEAMENDDVSEQESSNVDVNGESDSCDDDDDDAVEEVKGSAARETTTRLRESERKTAKGSMSKKKRRKKDDVAPPVDENENDDEISENEDESKAGDDLLTEDFFKKVDSERADQLQKTKREEKMKKVQQKRLLGKHTTFVAEDGYKMTDKPHKNDHNIELVPIGRGETSETSVANDERQLLMSATLGTAPSKAAIAFSRGSLACGTRKERGSDSRKRKSKNEDTWKRSRRVNSLGIGSRSGQPATLFVLKR